jgi:hypothetical protein
MPLLNTPKKLLFSQGNLQIIAFSNLIDVTTLIPIDIDTLVATMIDCNGNPVPGCTNIALPNTDALGDYMGTFGDNNFYPLVGTGYTLLIDGNNGSGGGYIHFEVMVEIVSRQQ